MIGLYNVALLLTISTWNSVIGAENTNDEHVSKLKRPVGDNNLARYKKDDVYDIKYHGETFIHRNSDKGTVRVGDINTHVINGVKGINFKKVPRGRVNQRLMKFLYHQMLINRDNKASDNDLESGGGPKNFGDETPYGRATTKTHYETVGENDDRFLHNNFGFNNADLYKNNPVILGKGYQNVPFKTYQQNAIEDDTNKFIYHQAKNPNLKLYRKWGDTDHILYHNNKYENVSLYHPSPDYMWKYEKAPNKLSYNDLIEMEDESGSTNRVPSLYPLLQIENQNSDTSTFSTSSSTFETKQDVNSESEISGMLTQSTNFEEIDESPNPQTIPSKDEEGSDHEYTDMMDYKMPRQKTQNNPGSESQLGVVTVKIPMGANVSHEKCFGNIVLDELECSDVASSVSPDRSNLAMLGQEGDLSAAVSLLNVRIFLRNYVDHSCVGVVTCLPQKYRMDRACYTHCLGLQFPPELEGGESIAESKRRSTHLAILLTFLALILLLPLMYLCVFIIVVSRFD